MKMEHFPDLKIVMMMYKCYDITPLRPDIDVNKSRLRLREQDLTYFELYLFIIR